MRILPSVFPEAGAVAAQISGVGSLRAIRRREQPHGRADPVGERLHGAVQRQTHMLRIRLRRQRSKALGDRVDPAGFAFRRADGRAVVVIATAVPAPVPGILRRAPDPLCRLMERIAFAALQLREQVGKAMHRVREEPREPYALALPAAPGAIHPVVPVAVEQKQQTVRACAAPQYPLCRAKTVLQHGAGAPAGTQDVIARPLVLRQRLSG